MAETRSAKERGDHARHWVSGAIQHPGALRAELKIKKGEKIPAKKLAAAAKKGGKEGERARLAETMRKWRK